MFLEVTVEYKHRMNDDIEKKMPPSSDWLRLKRGCKTWHLANIQKSNYDNITTNIL